MSIVTKKGDKGETSLMYNRRVPKSDLHIEACGAVDELNAALGLARATATDDFVRDHVTAIQRQLVGLMGELATRPEDLPRYVQEGYLQITPGMTSELEKLIERIEAGHIASKDWVMPGANAGSAALDLARTICRRAERRVCALQTAGQIKNAETIVYLNRLSDLLWLLARWTEKKSGEVSSS